MAGFGRPLRSFWAHFALSRSRRLKRPGLLRRQQPGHPHKVVCRRHQVTGQTRTLRSTIPGAPKTAHRLHPTEYPLNTLAHPLTLRIPGMTRRPAVYRRMDPTCHVRRDPTDPQLPYACPGVVAPCPLPPSWGEPRAFVHRPASRVPHRARLCHLIHVNYSCRALPQGDVTDIRSLPHDGVTQTTEAWIWSERSARRQVSRCWKPYAAATGMRLALQGLVQRARSVPGGRLVSPVSSRGCPTNR